ncbi:hypothetical protein [Evansella tamaricis]|uniref:Uncharacterized protein n=1 Tax=Evansella tamaricis TaxID=2069301 RepID=A0ABS6JL89_9BACI|nr:hypothetical protein [Evansella tamaricis]MBU9714437.1 hypothetical protein [Evansella tamaricis]
MQRKEILDYIALIVSRSQFTVEDVLKWEADFFMEVCRLIDNCILDIERQYIKNQE